MTDSGRKRKREESHSSTHCAKEKKGVFGDNILFILQAGIGKARTDLFHKQVQKHHGLISTEYDSSVTHIICDERMDYSRLCKILKVDSVPDHVIIVKSLWLSKCLKELSLVPVDGYELERPSQLIECCPEVTSSSPLPGTADDVSTAHKFPKVGEMHRFVKCKKSDGSDADSDYVASDDESIPAIPEKSQLPKGNWVCAQSSAKQNTVNHNKAITDKLEAMVKIYESTNDQWRAFSYKKAIAVLKRQSKPISSYEEAKTLPGVGERLADKIWEISESGNLQKLQEMSANEQVTVLELFQGVWGAGAATARAWYAQGMRTLEDLRTKATLTRHQKIGLQYYDDLQLRMSYDEAGQIEKVVREAALSVCPTLVVMACGSYRRKKPTCGDVDVLITHEDGKSHKGVFGKILDKLKEIGFLTADLVQHEENGNQKKYMGICKLPGDDHKHRRLDIIVVPYEEFACAVMYFTGSAHFNRSMRNLAKKMNMSLSEHSLNSGVIRQNGEKVNKGVPLVTPTEESIFKHLGLHYRPPEERDH